MKLGYLVPEFPGQTHAFLWREIKALQETGIDVDIVSTRPAPREIVCHTWSSEAMRRTKYLFPPGPKDLLAAFQALMMAGPGRWYKCLSTIRSAEGENFLGRVRLIGLLVLGSRLARLAKRARWSHLHVHSCADSAYIALFAKLLADLSYSLTLHGPLNYYGGGQRDKWRGASFAITVSRRLADEVVKSMPEVNPDLLRVSAMGVCLSLFERQEPYNPWVPSEPCCLASCGRLHRGKGFADLIQAVHLLHNHAKLPVRLRILGEGPARAELERLIHELRLDQVVDLIGAVPEECVRDTLEASHVFVLASHSEAIGVATMEAMAMSLPVVVTHVGGVAELVRDGVDGLLVPPKNPRAMAEAIQRLLGDPGLSARMGQAGAKRVRESFGSHVSAGVIAARLGIGVEEADQKVST